MYLPENLPASAQLQATLSALPEAAATQAKAAIGEREGKVDNKTRIEILKEEERKIKEEQLELLEDQAKEISVSDEKITLEAADDTLVAKDDAVKEKERKVEKPIAVELLPNLTALLGPEILRHSTAKTVQETIERRLTKHVPHPLADLQKDALTMEDIEKIESALDVLGSQKRELYIETEELQDLKEELADYQEDLKDLDTISKDSKVVETKAAKRLYKRVNSLIGNLEQVVNKLQKEGTELKVEIEGKAKEEVPEVQQSKLVSIQELIEAIQSIQSVSDPAKMERIVDVLETMDDDADGRLEVDAVLKVIELIGRENVKLSPNQIAEIVNVLEKEENLGLSKSDKGVQDPGKSNNPK
jgi:LETM1 and EF-hand domain-containing protein 1